MLAEIIELAWPHYDSSDPLSDLPLIAQLRPQLKEGDEVNKRGVVYRLLERPPAPSEERQRAAQEEAERRDSFVDSLNAGREP